MIRLTMILMSLLLMAAVCPAEEKSPLAGKKAKDSYSLGYDFGNSLRSQEVDLDEEVLIAAIREALEGKKPQLKIEEMMDNLKQLRKEVLIRYNLRKERQAAKNKEEGMKFLADNKTREGVTTLPSGLQYKVLAEGSGPSPRATDMVKVRYRGTLVNGTEFDSRTTETTIKVDGVIRGWTEALQLMKTGAKWQLFVPAELAYDKRPSSRIPSNSALIFEIELLSIEKEAASPKADQKLARDGN
jgi:FKBP-type peptidyl-prolyl cis-trans isomerase FklB